MVAVVALLLSACDVNVPISAVDAGLPTADAGAHPAGSDAGNTLLPELIETQHVLEDFENRNFIDPLLSENVVIDTNRGVATLPAERFPSLTDGKIMNLVSTSEFEGVVEGASILLEPGVEIEAMDAIELRAADTLRISGRLRAGPGGITLVAGRSLFVDGRVESLGPIRVRLASEEGLIHVSGKLLTQSVRSGQSAEITILGRGDVDVSGEIRTGDGLSGSGLVLISSYHDVHIDGALAFVSSGSASEGTSGSVQVLSEGEVEISNGAIVGSGRSSYETSEQLGPGAGGGDIEIRAVSRVRAHARARVLAGAHVGRVGGALRLVSGDELLLSQAELTGGEGGLGGAVQLEARTASIGPDVSVSGGNGLDGGGTIELSTADALAMQLLVMRGGATECGDAGSVRIHVGGRILVGSEVSLLGGPGGRSSNRCIDGGRGGDVVVLAKQGESSLLTAASMPGNGARSGERSVTIDRDYERPMPDVRVRTMGALVSRVIDRGAQAVGSTPRLLSFQRLTPEETEAKIQLAGATSPQGPFEPWHEANAEDAESLRALKEARYFRYRVWLQGRALDAPEVDTFELDLSSR